VIRKEERGRERKKNRVEKNMKEEVGV